MSRIRLATSAFIAAVALGVAGSSQAGIVWYTDRTAWEAAIGAPSFTEDFSGFAADTQFRTSPVGLDGLSIEQEGTDASFRNLVEVSPFPFSDNNGTSHASMFTDFGATYVRLTFGALNAAFGGESWIGVLNEGAQMEVYDGATLLGSQALTSGSGDFLGYVLTGGDSATSVRLASVDSLTGGEGFGVDNLAGKTVPEPGTLALLGLGLAGLAASRRRKQ